MFSDYKTLTTTFSTWYASVIQTVVKPKENIRSWCMFGVEALNLTAINKLFDRKEIADKFQAIRTNSNSKEPYTPLLYDLHGIASFHKGFSVRHKTRLQIYRDDLIARTKNQVAINIAYVKENNLIRDY